MCQQMAPNTFVASSLPKCQSPQWLAAALAEYTRPVNTELTIFIIH
jgi:hypothetical protein